jgi:hypothetical protein
MNNFDILVKSVQNIPIAAIEIKNMKDVYEEDAINQRRNMIAHGMLNNVPYFIFLTQERGFLWKNDMGMESPPLVKFSMKNVLKNYLSELTAETRFKESELELIVRQWLFSLAQNGKLKNGKDPEKTLSQTGFLDSIQNALIYSEVTV